LSVNPDIGDGNDISHGTGGAYFGGLNKSPLAFLVLGLLEGVEMRDEAE
jgi:hypothetical protein